MKKTHIQKKNRWMSLSAVPSMALLAFIPFMLEFPDMQPWILTQLIMSYAGATDDVDDEPSKSSIQPDIVAG